MGKRNCEGNLYCCECANLLTIVWLAVAARGKNAPRRVSVGTTAYCGMVEGPVRDYQMQGPSPAPLMNPQRRKKAEPGMLAPRLQHSPSLLTPLKEPSLFTNFWPPDSFGNSLRIPPHRHPKVVPHSDETKGTHTLEGEDIKERLCSHVHPLLTGAVPSSKTPLLFSRRVAALVGHCVEA